MPSPADALQTQISNIQERTSKSLAELSEIAASSGLTKHGELRSMFQEILGLGYGDANSLVHAIQQSDGERAAAAKGLVGDAVLDEIYSGAKASLRPIHDALMARVALFGPYDVVPKKGYVSLRTSRQFAMIGPATKSAVEVGINLKQLEETNGWTALPVGSMCNYKIRLSSVDEVTDTLVASIRAAYDI